VLLQGVKKKSNCLDPAGVEVNTYECKYSVLSVQLRRLHSYKHMRLGSRGLHGKEEIPFSSSGCSKFSFIIKNIFEFNVLLRHDNDAKLIRNNGQWVNTELQILQEHQEGRENELERCWFRLCGMSNTQHTDDAANLTVSVSAQPCTRKYLRHGRGSIILYIN
jgi:hypothetical protein